MTDTKSQSGRLTAARLKEITERVNRDGQLRLTLSCDDLRSILCELQRMKAVLREHEWQHPPFSSDPYEYCFMCGAKKEDGHEPACWYAALLTDAPAGEDGKI